MRFKPAPALLLALSASLAGCQSASSDYPSLAVRDAERITGTLEPAPVFVAPTVAPSVLGRLEQLGADAAAAHRAFLDGAPAARRLSRTATGAGVGSDAWAEAQVAIAGLESARSRAMIALADLDRLYVDAALEGAELVPIAAVRDRVIAQVGEQDAAIAGMLRGLR